jgi:hypothetical protein
MPQSPRKFLGRPNLGGWLAMLNAALWLLIGITVQTVVPGSALVQRVTETTLAISTLVLSLPLTPCFCGLVGPHRRGEDIVLSCLLVGLNAFLWGHGLARLYHFLTEGRLTRADRRRAQGLCPRCGYDLRATPEKGQALLDRCPECGHAPDPW